MNYCRDEKLLLHTHRDRARAPQLGVRQKARALVVQGGQQVLRGDHGHARARLGGGAGHVRRDQGVGQVEQWVLGRKRRGVGEVERGEHGPRAKRIGKGAAVDKLAVRGVDQQRVGPHQRQRIAVDQLVGVVGERAVQRDDLTAGKQLVQRNMRRASGLLDRRAGRGVGIQNLHPKATRAPRHRLPDSAHANNAKRCAVDIAAQQHFRAPAAPLPGLEILHAFANPARGRQHERKREIGAGFGGNVGRDHHQHAALRGRRQVDILAIGGVVAYCSEVRRSRQQRGIDALGGKRQQAIEPGHLFHQHHARRRLLARPDAQARMAGQQIQRRLRQAAGHIYARAFGHGGLLTALLDVRAPMVAEFRPGCNGCDGTLFAIAG